MTKVATLLVLVGLHGAQAGVTFTLHSNLLDWSGAKAACEALGERLAVLDTVEKQTALQNQITDVTGMYKWVGVRANYSDAFIWLNGEVLQRDDPYWNPIGPTDGYGNCGYLRSDYFLGDDECSEPGEYICEHTEPSLVKSAMYIVDAKNKEITSSQLITLQVISSTECGAECLLRSCSGFSFHQSTPGGGMCKINMAATVTQLPLEGSLYYIQN